MTLQQLEKFLRSEGFTTLLYEGSLLVQYWNPQQLDNILSYWDGETFRWDWESDDSGLMYITA